MKQIGLLVLFLFGALGTNACKKKTAEPDAPLAPPPVSSGAACANPLALAGVTAKADLAWQQDPAAAQVVSTVNYGNHSVLALSTQFNGDNLTYRVVSVNHPDANTDLHAAADGTQCAYVVKGQSNTGYVEISTLCAGEVYQIFLQTCNRNGDCSTEQALPAPYLQDRNRDAGVQSALAGVTQSRTQVDATATQAYNAIIAYLQAHKGDSNPSPERKQFLSMAQNVEDMGLDLYKVVMYTHYQDTLATVQANFHLADSTSAAAPPTSTGGCTPVDQIVGGDGTYPTNTTTTTTSNAIGDTVTVDHTVNVVVTETETETVTTSGSTGLTSGQKAEIGIGSVFLFAGAILTVGLILKQNDLRKQAVVQQEAVKAVVENLGDINLDAGKPLAEAELKTEVERVSARTSVEGRGEIVYKDGKAYQPGTTAKDFVPKNEIIVFDAEGKKIEIGKNSTGPKDGKIPAQYRSVLYKDAGSKTVMQGTEPTKFKSNNGEIFFGESATKLATATGEAWTLDSIIPAEGKFDPAGVKGLEALATEKLGGEVKAKGDSIKVVQQTAEKIKGEKVKIWNVKEKVSAEKASGYVGIAIGVLLVVGAILTAVGGSGSGLADTGSTAEADLLTALSPLARQQSSNLLQYQGSFVPVSTAVQASTAGKK